MRALLLSAAILLAACSGKAPDNQAAPAPQPTGPAPKTPQTDVEPPPGNADSWMEVPSNADDAKTAPYGNLLDQPLVNGHSPAR